MPTKKYLFVAFILLATLIDYWQVRHSDFISYDDSSYVRENSHIQNGLTLESIRWAFTAAHASNWHPLTWISHMVDVQLFGLQAGWHHFTNVLFHLANTLLLLLILQRMTKSFWRSAFVAALFALHPLHVESVAWVAERKDVLSTFFWMLTTGMYVSYVARPGLSRYLGVLCCFALGLMAKPMLVTLPFVFLLLDYWPLQRLGRQKPLEEVVRPVSKNRKKPKNEARSPELPVKGWVPQWSLVLPLLKEKLPLFALAALSSAVTYLVQQHGGAMETSEVFPLSARVANAFVSYIAYVAKMLWPANLALLYPHPGWWPLWQVLGSAALFIIITAAILRRMNEHPYAAVGWLWYVGTLVPVIGIVQVGVQAMADRYTYVPLIGLFIIVAWGVPDLLRKWPRRNEALVALSAPCLLCLPFLTWRQVGYWRNSITLYDHTLEVTDRNSVILNDRAVAYNELGNYTQAIGDLDKAIEINPRYVKAYNNRGNAYNALGRYFQAIADFDTAVGISPAYAEAYNNRGNAYCALGKYAQAMVDYSKAIGIDAGYGEAYNNRGNACKALGDYVHAIADLNKAIEINPAYGDAYNNRGGAYNGLGEYTKAIADLNKAIEIDPNTGEPYHNRGNAYSGLGEYARAIADYDTAIKMDPGDADTYNNRGNAYNGLGDHARAIADYSKAIEINPKHAMAHNNRGAALNSLGDYARAIADLEKATELDPGYGEAYDNLGNALKSLGNYAQAIANYEKAIEINPKDWNAYNDRGAAYGSLVKYVQAIADYDKAIGINPRDPNPFNNRGVAYGRLGKNDRAIADFDKAIEIDPKYGEAYANRGIINGVLGNHERAIADLKAAAQLGDERARSLLRNQAITW